MGAERGSRLRSEGSARVRLGGAVSLAWEGVAHNRVAIVGPELRDELLEHAQHKERIGPVEIREPKNDGPVIWSVIHQDTSGIAAST
jgi:hypothetical protein